MTSRDISQDITTSLPCECSHHQSLQVEHDLDAMFPAFSAKRKSNFKWVFGMTKEWKGATVQMPEAFGINSGKSPNLGWITASLGNRDFIFYAESGWK